MSTETAWANQQEWAQEKGEIEIKKAGPAKAPAVCCVLKCETPATVNLTVGEVQEHHGIDLDFCADHEEDWAEWYGYYGNQES